MPSKREAMTAKALELIGCGYIYGATGWICTRRRLDEQANQYPLYADLIYRYGPKWMGLPCYDCAQLTRAVAKEAGISLPSGSASQWRAAGVWMEKGLIGEMPDEAGLFVFSIRDGTVSHTAVTIGGGETVDARGHAYGVMRRRIRDASYTHWARLAVDYDSQKEEENTPVSVNMPVIRAGSRGEAVREAQRILQELGYYLGNAGVDGVFGSMTRTAVIRFQRNYGLAADGIVGPMTWEMLRMLEV